jgi:hypothetical protein
MQTGTWITAYSSRTHKQQLSDSYKILQICSFYERKYICTHLYVSSSQATQILLNGNEHNICLKNFS